MILAALPAAFAAESGSLLPTMAIPDRTSIPTPYVLDYYQFSNIPKGDAYTTISTKSVQLTAGSTVKIKGLWDPDFAQVWVAIERTDGSRATSSPLTTESTATLTVPVTGYYDLKISSLTYALDSGYLSVTW